MKLTEKNREDDTQEVAETEKFNKSKTQKLFREKNVNQTMLEKILKFEEDFAKIQAATQIKDFDQLVSIFIKNEEKVNYKNYIFFKNF